MPEQLSNSGLQNYGRVLEGPILVFSSEGHEEYCQSGGSAQWNESDMEITGYAWGAIYDVITKGSASERNLRMRLDHDHVHDIGTSAGGEDFGVVTYVPRLVQL